MKNILFLFFFFFPVATIFAQENLKPLVDKIASPYIANKNNRALVIAVVTKNGEQIFTYGETEKGNGIKPDASSTFEIGEVTAVFTSSLLAVFETNGMLDLNDPVQQYFPESVHIPYYEEIICKPIEENTYSTDHSSHTIYYCFADPSYHPKQMLLCDLATNTSGLPAFPNNLNNNLKSNNPFTGYSLTDLYTFLNEFRTSYPTGLNYKFSPLGIAMLGNGLAWKSGSNYEELLKLNVLDPLQLEHTYISGEALMPYAALQGHDHKGNKVPATEFSVMAPALGLHSNANDLILFIKANLNLSESAIQVSLSNTHNPRVEITNDKKLRGSYSALGWIITPFSENNPLNIVWQHGKTIGSSSYIGFIKEREIGVVVLSNSVNGVDEIGKEVLDLLYNEKIVVAPDSSKK